MLLAGLQGKPVRRITVFVQRNADDPAWDRALIGVSGREICGVRAAEAERNAESLTVADGDIRAERAWRGQVGQGQQIGCDHGKCALCVGLFHDIGVIMHGTVRVRILQQDSKGIFRQRLILVTDHHGQPGRCGACLKNVDGLRMTVLRDIEHSALVLRRLMTESHGFRRCRSLIEQRGIGDFQARKIADHGLEVQEHFQPTLTNLRLIGRVGRIPGRIFQNVALDNSRDAGAIIAHANQRAVHRVGIGIVPELLQHRAFGLGGRQIERLLDAYFCRNGGLDKRINALVAERLEHHFLIFRARADMTTNELFAFFLFGEGQPVVHHLFCSSRPVGPVYSLK